MASTSGSSQVATAASLVLRGKRKVSDFVEDGPKRTKEGSAAQRQVWAASGSALPTSTDQIWIRAEVASKNPRGAEADTKMAVDRRAPLAPADAKTLISQGFTVTVEKSASRAFSDQEYADAGCVLVEPKTWVNAPPHALIMGLRDFAHGFGDDPVRALSHRHLFFSHAFKGQPGWQESVVRFLRGGGALLDYEYLVNDFGKRVASFGEEAGNIGMAVGILSWCRQILASPSVGMQIPADLVSKLDDLPLLQHMQSLLKLAVDFCKEAPKVVVIGAGGRAGSGAVRFARSLGLQVVEWGRKDTKKGGPFEELLDFHILINAIRLESNVTRPFLTRELMHRKPQRSLSVVVDISCDTLNPHNPLPIYSRGTSFEQPTLRVIEEQKLTTGYAKPLDVIAIPNLPSLLPIESSRVFSSQLLPLLSLLNTQGFAAPVWQRCSAVFFEKSFPLSPSPLSIGMAAGMRAGAWFGDPSLARTGSVVPTYTQERIFTGYHKKLFPSQAEIAVFSAVKVAGLGPLDARRLEVSLRGLALRHDILRTVFSPAQSAENGHLNGHEEDGAAPAAPAHRVTLTVLAGLPSDEDAFAAYLSVLSIASGSGDVGAEYNRLILERACQQPLHPEKAQSFHVSAIHSGSDDGWVLCGLFHPLIADEHSVKIFLHELVTAYHSGIYSLGAPPLQFSDFARYEAQVSAALAECDREEEAVDPATSEGLSVVGGQVALTRPSDSDPVAKAQRDLSHLALRDLKYWRSVLQYTPPVVQIPADFSRKVEANFVCVSKTLALSPAISHSVRQVAQAGGDLAVFSLFLSVYSLVLYRRTGEADLLLTSTFSGRTRANVGQTLGPFAHQVALRMTVNPSGSFAEFYQSVIAQVRAAYDHQEIAYHRLVHTLKAGSEENEKEDSLTFHPLSTQYSPIEFVMTPDVANIDHLQLPQLPQGVGVSYWQSPFTLTPMDLSLKVVNVAPSVPGPQLFGLQLTYNPQIFAAVSIDEFLAQMELVLSALPQNLPTSMLKISLITPAARPLLPQPSKPLDSSWSGPITECFARSAARVPDAPAIMFKDLPPVPYGVLNALTNQLANAILASGLGPGDVIGLYGHRSPAVVWAIMGILKSGAAYSMMDPKYPAERIVTCLQVAKITGWLQLEAAGALPKDLDEYLTSLNLKFRHGIPPVDNAVSLFDKKDGKGKFSGQYAYLSAVSAEYPKVKIYKDTVAVVTFTSGSTGIPKGVMGRHVSLTHFYPWMAERYGISESDRFSLCSGIAHDPLQRDIFTPLFFGASIMVPTDEDIAEPGQLAQWFHDKAVTVTCLTPAMGQLLTSMVGVSTDGRGDLRLPALKNAFFVGDMLIKRDVIRLRTLAPNVRCINMYGSTETQRAVGYIALTPASQQGPDQPVDMNIDQADDIDTPGTCPPLSRIKEVIPVGVGMRDVDLILLNSAGEMAGVGEVAEIYVRSPHIARGYLGLDAATAEKFINNPFRAAEAHQAELQAVEKEHETEELKIHGSAALHQGRVVSWKSVVPDRMYRTGDLGRYVTREGRVECCGRADDQVKIRGFRIELGEINAFLSKHPAVKENVTIVREDSPGQKQLVSYVIPVAANPLDGVIDTADLQKTLKDHLRAHLPTYMVPSHIVILQAMPLTPNGKINRAALPPPAAPAKVAQPAAQRTAKTASAPKPPAPKAAVPLPLPSQSPKPESAEPEHKSLHPLSPLESLLEKLWSKLLGVPSVAITENFFDLGGHSLLATQMTLELRKTLGFRVPMTLLFEHPTVAAMAKAIEAVQAATQATGGEKKEAKTDELDLEKEVVLPAEITAPVAADLSAASRAFNPACVFLTGSTGFLGAFLLSELLKRTKAQVICAVRSSTAADALSRVKNNLSLHLLWNDDYADRIVPLVADLSKPLLGLSQPEFDALAAKIDLIVHNGAVVHWLLPYEKLKPANVLGTVEILRLACTKSVKPVHYVSTTSVYDDNAHKSQKVIYETDDLQNSPAGLSGGYPRSKWVAERTLILARKRGIPVSIYRPGYVTGDSKNGLWNTDDFLCRLIKGCLQLGAAPFALDAAQDETKATVDMSPVDYVAQSIVHLSLQPYCVNKNFNVVNPSPFFFADVFGKIRSFGYDLKALPYAQWRQRLLEDIESGKQADNALVPIISHFSETWAANLTNPKYDMAQFDKGVAGTPIRCPTLDEVIFTYVSYLISCKFIEPPVDTAHNKLAINWTMIGEGIQRLTRTNRS